MKNALFTINVGNYLSDNARESFIDAARRWDCQYVEHTHGSDCPPTALKFRVFDLCDADRVFMIDGDAIISQDAPNPFDLFLAEKFWAVKNDQPHFSAACLDANPKIALSELNLILDGVLKPEERHYLAHHFFNGGVWLADRIQHGEALRLARHLYETYPGKQWVDQIPLNCAVWKLHGGYSSMGFEWNWIFPEKLDRMTAHVYHFAGDPQRHERIKQVNWR